MNAPENTGRRRRRTFADNRAAVAAAHKRKQANRPSWTLDGFLARCAAAKGTAAPSAPVAIKAAVHTKSVYKTMPTHGNVYRPCDWLCLHALHAGHDKAHYPVETVCKECGTPAPWVR